MASPSSCSKKDEIARLYTSPPVDMAVVMVAMRAPSGAHAKLNRRAFAIGHCGKELKKEPKPTMTRMAKLVHKAEKKIRLRCGSVVLSARRISFQQIHWHAQAESQTKTWSSALYQCPSVMKEEARLGSAVVA